MRKLLFVVGLGVILSMTLWLSPRATAQLTPNSPLEQEQFLGRVSYQNMAEVQQLADAGYDIWENNLEQRYLLIAMNALIYERLRVAGWEIVVQPFPELSVTADTSRTSTTFYGGYRTVEGVYADLQTTHEQYPHLTELIDYGDSYCKQVGGCSFDNGNHQLTGFDLQAIRITNEAVSGSSRIENGQIVQMGEKPIFFLVATLHAREITTPEVAMRFLDMLVEGYEASADTAWVLDEHEVWIVPIANPDGHWIVELGTPTPFTQRKNGHFGCLTWPPTSASQVGVDLNRNHSFQWNTGGSSGNPCDLTYYGTAPASEPEVSALQDLIASLIPDQRGAALTDPAPEDTKGILITMHSYSELVLWPWGFTDQPAPNSAGLQAIGNKLASFNGYFPCQPSVCLYAASGTTDDWSYGELGIPSFTFELGTSFMPSYSQVDSIQWPDNGPALYYAAKIAAAPYQMVQGPEVRDVQAVLADGQLTINASADDTDTGNDDIAAVVYSWSLEGETAPLSASDGTYDQASEAAEIVLEADQFFEPSYTLYVQAQDSAGHWGPPTAVRFEGAGRQIYLPLLVH